MENMTFDLGYSPTTIETLSIVCFFFYTAKFNSAHTTFSFPSRFIPL